MSWKDIYNQKLVSAEEALKHVGNGNRIVVGHAMAEPSYLLREMVRLKDNYLGLQVCSMVPAEAPYAGEHLSKHMRLNSLFLGGSTRKAVENNEADFTPCFFSEVPNTFSCGALPADVAMIMVSKPDKHGYCSFGISVDFTKTVAECAKVVIAQVNENMPRTHGNTFIHVSDIDFIVEHNEPLIELPRPKITEVEEKIGKNCASLINDGDCLQLGIGAIPDAVLMFLTDKKDLGIHSEMISDGVMHLMKNGNINNKAKNFHNRRAVVTFLMGTKEFYDFVDDNPEFELLSVDYVNDPRVIAQNDNMVCINSCIEVDLMGQVVSSSIGLRQFSGVGGQVDFVRGAAWSKGGRSIIAMPSTAKGKFSKIKSFITEGATVTTSLNDVEYIVTEYGIAKLKGMSLRQRAESLINIAHPDFRPELAEEYERRFGHKLDYKKD